MVWNYVSSPLCQSLMSILLPFWLIAMKVWLPDCSDAELSREKSLRKRNCGERPLQHRDEKKWSVNARHMASLLITCVSPPCFPSSCPNPAHTSGLCSHLQRAFPDLSSLHDFLTAFAPNAFFKFVPIFLAFWCVTSYIVIYVFHVYMYVLVYIGH